MSSKKEDYRWLSDKFQSNKDRMSEMADLCEKEQRELTEAEQREFNALCRENQILQVRMWAMPLDQSRENHEAEQKAVKIIRENAARGSKTEILVKRDSMMVEDVSTGALVPLKVQDILKPLQEGFILDKVGLPMPTGLAGDYVWPTYEMVEASIAGEGVSLTDTKIPFNKLTASPERIGIAIPVTNQSLNQSEGILETVVREIMPHSIRLLLNQILFSTEKVTGSQNLIGPFANIVDGADGYNAVVSLSETPTFKELNGMKAAVLETGIEGSHLCWIMTKSMQAILEGTPINSEGIFAPMLQNGTLCGLPVYTTNEIRNSEGTEYIGLGDWRYQPMGLFGSIRFIVDPYSQARKDSVDFVLNVDYGTKTLRPKAFILGQVGTAASE